MLGLLASILGFYSNARQRKIEFRDQNSGRFINSNKKDVQESLGKLSEIFQASDADERRAIIVQQYSAYVNVAMSFELACVYIGSGYASIRIIDRVEGNNLSKFFVAISSYVNEVRTNPADPRPKLMIHLEAFHVWREFMGFSLAAWLMNLWVRDKMLSTLYSFRAHYWLASRTQGLNVDYTKERRTDALRGIRIVRTLAYLSAAIAIYFLFID
ncbi:MAG: hypothetical protein AAGI92_07945 [Pseudomonadota bacterium]